MVYSHFFRIFAPKFYIFTFKIEEKTMGIFFEKDVLDYLNLPSIPKREWDGESPFAKGVAVVLLLTGGEAYAVASFDPNKEKEPNIVKVFCSEQFTKLSHVYVVPDYMETDIKNTDLDDESKKKAEEIIKEANEIAEEGSDVETKTNENTTEKNPYIFDFIHNDEEAIAFIEAYNKKNKIQGKTPKKHESILLRLEVIFSETNSKNENNVKSE